MSNPAESYEEYIVPALFEPWAAELMQRIVGHPGDDLLDVACGTGIVARRSRPALGDESAVCGVDPNPNMLAVARRASEREKVAVDWHEGRAEELPFPDASFRMVLCQQGAQFFSDRPQGFAEMRRILDEEGRIATSTWLPIEHHPFFSALNDAMQRHLGTAAASAPFTLGDAAEVKQLLSAAGFHDIEIEHVTLTAKYPDPERFLDETVNALMAVVVSMLDIGEDELARGVTAVKEELREPLEAAVHDNVVHLPWHSHIATAKVSPAR